MKKKQKKRAEEIKKSPLEKTGSKNLKWVLLPFVLLLTIFIYYPSLKNDWTNWDDRGYVLDNDLTKNLNANTFSQFFYYFSSNGKLPSTSDALSCTRLENVW